MGRRVVRNQYDFRMTSILEEGKSGAFELKKTVIPKGTIINMYDSDNGRIIKGEYSFDYPAVILYKDGNPIMSDTQLEIESLARVDEMVKGRVLISGLGIGLLPTLIRDNPEVESIDIVEKYQDVVDLVFAHIATSKMNIIVDDIFHYLETTDKRYDFIHIDIWNDIHAPLQQIANAQEYAKECLKPNGIVWCWLQELYDRIKEKLPKKPTSQTSSAGFHEPCLICGKTFRNDYAGLCMDCADMMGVSEMCIRK